MVTNGNVRYNSQDQAVQAIVYYGLSTDAKPASGVGNGSCFIEMDTSKIYFYDETGSLWLEWGN